MVGKRPFNGRKTSFYHLYRPCYTDISGRLKALKALKALKPFFNKFLKEKEKYWKQEKNINYGRLRFLGAIETLSLAVFDALGLSPTISLVNSFKPLSASNLSVLE